MSASKRCPKCNESFYTEYMSDPISICIEDACYRRGTLFYKTECRFCNTQWHLVKLPKDCPVEFDSEGNYVIKHPDRDLEWEDIVIFDGVIPDVQPYVPLPKHNVQQQQKDGLGCIIC